LEAESELLKSKKQSRVQKCKSSVKSVDDAGRRIDRDEEGEARCEVMFVDGQG
jgi:hypothetical protein